jgi:CheY-like chemotaxis protein
MASQKYSYEIEAMASEMEDGCASHLLLVEDSAHYVRQLQEALRDVNASINLHVADDGINAMVFLRHEGINVNAPCSDLILLHLNLPRMDGREVLVRIKTERQFEDDPDHNSHLPNWTTMS